MGRQHRDAKLKPSLLRPGACRKLWWRRRITSTTGDVPKRTAKRWLSEQDAYTLHKPVRRRFKRRRVVVGGQNQQWQADLVDVANLKKYNDGTKFLLTVIDVFSKRAWCVPLKNKVGATLERLLTENTTPTALQTDKGTEFLNRPFQKLVETHGIHHFVTHNEETKASIVERLTVR